ncbi:MAG: tripartite tricarboxylate transporter TctB family protein [Clostridiales bacterium]|nr:tripartite tricarboxylate transporter TctB family protein [Clostridiales bacterium]
MIDFGFWDGGPTPGFFPIIIAVVLLLASIASFIQVARDKDGKDVQYNRAELMVILGAAGIIIGSMVIGLILSCLVYLVLWLKLVEHAPWKHVIIIEAILAAIIIGVFVVWLQVQFPMGLFEFIL